MENKTCTKCKETKSPKDFYVDKNKKDGLNNWCKSCHKIHKENNKNKRKEYHKKYYYKNKDKYKEYYEEYDKEYRSTPKYKEERRNYQRERYSNDLNYKYRQVLGVLTRRAYKEQGFKDENTLNLLGCSLEEFIKHLENQFLPEMTHDNYGEVWEIDHIIPLINFDLTKEENRKKANHFTNLQPLFKTSETAENFGYEGYIGNRNKKPKI